MRELLAYLFPARVATLILRMYAATRRISFSKSVSEGEAFVQAILAGCTFATTMFKVYFIACYDALWPDTLQ